MHSAQHWEGLTLNNWELLAQFSARGFKKCGFAGQGKEQGKGMVQGVGNGIPYTGRGGRAKNCVSFHKNSVKNLKAWYSKKMKEHFPIFSGCGTTFQPRNAGAGTFAFKNCQKKGILLK